MPKDGILWTTGILRGDFQDVCRFYSGDTWCPPMQNQWLDLSKRINASKFSFWEYYFWLVHFYKEANRPDLIKMRNMVCSSLLWSEFLQWKADADRYARIQMSIHVDEAKASSRLRPLKEVLMDTDIEVGPVARVEIGLRLDDPSPIVHAFSHPAGDVLRGMPEFINYAPALSKYLETPNAARQFLPT